MRLEISGFVQNDHFDLNSYLTYLFNKLHENPVKEEKKQKNPVTQWRKN
jgi:hypothetical protein